MLSLVVAAALATDPMLTDYLTTETSRVTPGGATRLDVGVQSTTLAIDHLGPTAYVGLRRGIGGGELTATAGYYHDNLATTAPATAVQSAAIGWKQGLGAWGPGSAAVLGRVGMFLNAGVPSATAMVALPYDWGSDERFLTLEPYVRYRGATTLQPVTPGLALGGIYTLATAWSLQAQLYAEPATYTDNTTLKPTTAPTYGGEVGASWRFQPSWSLDLNLGAGLDDIGHYNVGLYGLALRHAW